LAGVPTGMAVAGRGGAEVGGGGAWWAGCVRGGGGYCGEAAGCGQVKVLPVATLWKVVGCGAGVGWG
jgi:hypothetical protein